MFTLTIETDNAAFRATATKENLEPSQAEHDGALVLEIGRLLGELSNRVLLTGDLGGTLRDVNGNTVGLYSYAPDEPKPDGHTARMSAADQQKPPGYVAGDHTFDELAQLVHNVEEASASGNTSVQTEALTFALDEALRQLGRDELR